jgi:hypothetical protein
VDFETPRKTIDEACAPPVIAARVKPSAPSTRIDIETIPLPNKPVAYPQWIDAGLQGNIAF